MAYIDPEGMFGGDRMAMLSDKTRWVWPWLWCLGNSVGRFELNYRTVVERAFRQFTNRPTEKQFWEWIKELHNSWLLFVYEHEGQIWAQWNVTDRYLPQYAKRSDKETPAPSAASFLKWRNEYERHKKALAASKCPIANISSGVLKSFKKIRKFPLDVDVDGDVDGDVKPSAPPVGDAGAVAPKAAPRKRKRAGMATDEVWIDERHSEWYTGYWRHTHRDASLRAFTKRVAQLKADGMTREDAAAFLNLKVQEDRARFEPTKEWEWRRAMHPATYLNAAHWTDETPQQAAPVNGNGNRPMAVPAATDQRRSETLAVLDAIDRIKGRA